MLTTFPTIQKCNVDTCMYNHSGKCCTYAVNIGGPEPLCDTFSSSKVKGGLYDLVSKVGACKVDTCMYNTSYECTAEEVEIMQVGEHAE